MRAAEARDVLTGKAPPFPDPVARAIAADLAEAAKPPEPVIPRGMETPPNATAETAVALPEPPAPAAPSAGEARPEPAPEPPPSASEAAPAPPLRDSWPNTRPIRPGLRRSRRRNRAPPRLRPGGGHPLLTNIVPKPP